MLPLPQIHAEQFVIHDGDIPEDVYRQMASSRQIAWDLETTGLDWRNDLVALCQVHSESGLVALIRMGKVPPVRLGRLLSDNTVRKIFHHAMFDLRFMGRLWQVRPSNIACTKIASKLLFPGQPDEQRLQTLLQRFVGITIDKSEQTSEWGRTSYSSSQIAYAVRDVLYLFELFEVLTLELERLDLHTLAERCFAHIPTRLELELGGFGDVFTY
jgi:ribonuclease D